MSKISELLPNEFKMQMEKLFSDDYSKYLKAIDESFVRGIRINTSKISVEDFFQLSKVSQNLSKIDYAIDGFIFSGDEKIGNDPEHLSGLIYFQEPSSMVPVCASEIDKDNRPLKVLDLCAAPGGKTGQIASRVSDDSIIFSNEIIKSRAEILQSNVERLGLKNVVILNEEPKNLLCFEGYFDYVFVDAPCSGEGMFRKNPETISEWNKNNVENCFNRQKEILTLAQKLVCEGGKLVYSTCTFNDFEDEGIVDWFLENFNYELCDVNDKIKKSTISSNLKNSNGEFARKFLPYSGSGEGQFVAVLKNKDDSKNNSLYSKKHYKCIVQIGQSENKLVKEFSDSSLTESFDWRDLFRVGDSIYFAPKAFDGKMQTALETLKFVSVGVKIGTIEKGRFEPNHNIFMALQDKFKVVIELDEEQLKKYLHGEELCYEGNFKGYGVVAVNGFGVGGVKIVQGKMKNLYPRGLRI